MTYKTGCKPDHPKFKNKDWKYRGRLTSVQSFLNPSGWVLPKTFDNTKLLYDHILQQAQEGSCVSNSGASGFGLAIAFAGSSRAYLIDKTIDKFVLFSRRWLMAQAQKIDPWPETDPNGEDGTDIRSVLEVMTWGFVDENTVPYIAGDRVLRLTDEQRAKIVKENDMYKLSWYRTCMRGELADERLMKRAILESGSCVIGMAIPEGFYDPGSEGIIPESLEDAGGQHGYHALLLTGWDDNKKVFYGVNSWGKEWGKQGTFTMTIAEVIKRTYSAWVLGPIKKGKQNV